MKPAASTALYEIENAGMRYGSSVVLSDVTLQFHAGEMVAIAGPNGAGKSTLIGIMAGLRSNFTGVCKYESKSVASWSRRDLARKISVVPQLQPVEFAFTAEQVVLMGRTPFSDGMFESEADREAVRHAMQLTDCTSYRNRNFRTLSGGERQRVVLASALAQTPSALLLDEPTTFLDLEHQVATYRLLRDLSGQGLLTVAVTHDLNLAAAYSDRIVILHQGRVVADGQPAEVINTELIRSVFATEVVVERGSNGRPWIRYGI